MAKKERERERAGGELEPWRPFGELTRWEREMERFFDEMWGGRTRPWWRRRRPFAVEISAPPVDCYEDKDDVVVKAELPGIDRENIEINLTDRMLTIKGEKKREEKIEEKNYYRAERSYGSFVRSVELPREVQAEKAKASFKNGVLEIRIPKTEEAKRREIKVKVD
ncbi:MAG TPA: Hsp20/alpha crystallin family protein [candidate division Zixibacteria bacterium]|nr:Hsp20/alpha crystallin family protein [candidate division Zixibacteria bacterium]